MSTCQNILVPLELTEGLPQNGPVAVFRHFAKFLYSGMELPNDGTNALSKDGFDRIALKVIFQGRKGQI